MFHILIFFSVIELCILKIDEDTVKVYLVDIRWLVERFRLSFVIKFKHIDDLLLKKHCYCMNLDYYCAIPFSAGLFGIKEVDIDIYD